MSQAEFAVKWKQSRDQIRLWWTKLSDSDVDRIAGRHGHLLNVLQEKYGLTRAQAEAEIANRLEPRATRKKDAVQ